MSGPTGTAGEPSEDSDVEFLDSLAATFATESTAKRNRLMSIAARLHAAAGAAPANEPVGWMWQHEEVSYQLFTQKPEAPSPRWSLIGPVYLGAAPASPPDLGESEPVTLALKAEWARMSESERQAIRDRLNLPASPAVRHLEMALKHYRREISCSCHECRRAAGAKDGVGTNGPCKHSLLRQLVALASKPSEAVREAAAQLDAVIGNGDVNVIRDRFDALKAALAAEGER